MNLANPDQAFSLASLPVDGIGLARMEFIINECIKVHPMALVHPEKLDDATREKIDVLSAAHADPTDFSSRPWPKASPPLPQRCTQNRAWYA